MLDSPMGFIAVTDFEAAKAFYVGVLGLEFVTHDGFATVLRSGALLIRVTVPPHFTPAEYTVFGWRVGDIAAEVAALATKGVVFQHYPFFGDAQAANGVWTAPNGDKIAWFKDPCGNVLSLSQHVDA
jgi:catechol 2,3-dioxygenase-like lactoylglutathione lyase family enzyme